MYAWGTGEQAHLGNLRRLVDFLCHQQVEPEGDEDLFPAWDDDGEEDEEPEQQQHHQGLEHGRQG